MFLVTLDAQSLPEQLWKNSVKKETHLMKHFQCLMTQNSKNYNLECQGMC